MYEPNESDIQEYWEKGYWISPKLLDDERIEKLRQAAHRLFDGDYDGYGGLAPSQIQLLPDPLALRRVVNAWWANDEVRDMVLDPGLGRIAAALMKVDRVRLWADQVLLKPGAGGESKAKAANIGWHQDATYWHINTHRDNMITAWLALQDTDLRNGGMRTLEGSHRWGLIEDGDKFYDPDLDGQREYFKKKGGGPWLDEPCILKAGQASFHHSLCFHGSEINATNEPRMSVVGHYMPDGAAFEPSGKFQVFLPLLGPRPEPGQFFDGKAFPLVYPQEP